MFVLHNSMKFNWLKVIKMFVLNNWKNTWLWQAWALNNWKLWKFVQLTFTSSLESSLVLLLFTFFWDQTLNRHCDLQSNGRFGQSGPNSVWDQPAPPAPGFGALQCPVWLWWVSLWWKVSPPQVGGGDFCLYSPGRGGRWKETALQPPSSRWERRGPVGLPAARG